MVATSTRSRRQSVVAAAPVPLPAPALAAAQAGAPLSPPRAVAPPGPPLRRALRTGVFTTRLAAAAADAPVAPRAAPLPRVPGEESAALAAALAPAVALAAGDVLCMRGGAGLGAVGAVGGALGHVQLALGAPRLLEAGSAEAEELRAALPLAGPWPLLRLRTLESMRGACGLHEADQLLICQMDTGRVLMLGELTDEGVLTEYETGVEAELWRAPTELRAAFRGEVMAEALAEMREHQADWSLTTAARALMRSADVSTRDDPEEVYQELQDCWLEAPICTSVVIIFWQRYLQLLSDRTGGGDTAAAATLLRWMPLKADRALPGVLLSSMLRCGWSMAVCGPLPPSRILRSHSW